MPEALERNHPDTNSMVNQVLGSYRILGKIAHGGMGVVYRGEHTRLGRKVAIKVLRQDRLDSPDAVKRFLTEAQAVNQIGHPNIVDIIDFVEDASTHPPTVYAVMELLHGEDLADRLDRKGTLPLAEGIGIAIQVADAFIATHRMQIIHRDLKPANIFLAKSETGEEVVKLLDFGVAKTVGDSQHLGLTDPGKSVGTPKYMAPEQVLGRHLDGRTDVYALGIVLYQMFSGRVPFDSEQYGEILVAQVKDVPPPLNTITPTGRRVPDDVETLVMRCLEKDPEHRVQNMEDLKAELIRLRSNAQTEDELVLTVDDVNFVGAHRWRNWAMAAVGVLFLAGAVWFWMRSSTIETPPPTVVAPSKTVASPLPPPAPVVAVPVPAPIEPEKPPENLTTEVKSQSALENAESDSSANVPRKKRLRRKPETVHSIEGTVDPFQMGK